MDANYITSPTINRPFPPPPMLSAEMTMAQIDQELLYHEHSVLYATQQFTRSQDRVKRLTDALSQATSVHQHDREYLARMKKNEDYMRKVKEQRLEAQYQKEKEIVYRLIRSDKRRAEKVCRLYGCGASAFRAVRRSEDPAADMKRYKMPGRQLIEVMIGTCKTNFPNMFEKQE